MLKISVVTVCFNSAATISTTLDSLRAQSWRNFEHIVIDGGSTDGTLEILKAAGSDISRLVSEKDKGIYDAMNKGIALATGDVVGFINADDFFPYPHSLALVAAGFESSGADACYGDLCYVREDDISQVARYWRSCDYKPGLFERGWCPPHPTFYVRREVYQRLGGFDLSFRIAADAALMARFLAVEGISSHYIPQVLVHMRLGGTSNRSFRNIWTQNWEVARAQKKLGLRFSWLRFGLHKLLSRAGQFVLRPGEPKA